MPVTVTIAPGVDLTLEDTAAARIREQIDVALGAGDVAGVLADNHPLWDRHSGGDRHAAPEWTGRDANLADAFYAEVRGKAKVFLDLLLDHPGRQLSADDLIAAAPDVFTSAFSVAGAVNGLRLAQEASGRRYPFYWWEGTPSRYAVKPSVAALFNQVRAKAGR